MKKRILSVLLVVCMIMSMAPTVFATESNTYSGKVISILGDSISTFQGYVPTGYACRYPDSNTSCDVANVEATWWHQIITALDAQLGINDSWAGSTVSNVRTATPMASTTRINNLGNPDIILFFGGTNDLNEIEKNNLVLGSFDSENAPTEISSEVSSWDSFADAYTAAIVRLKASYPNARIIAILPMATGNYYSTDTLASSKSVMQAICSYYGVQYVDIGSVELYDGIHPTSAGMDAITAAVYTAITGNQMEEQKPADTTKGEVESRLRQIPLLTYNDTNLWSNPEAGYYGGTEWLDSYGTVCSITIAVVPGYHVYATSFQDAPANYGTRAGIRVTYFNGEEVVKSIDPNTVNAEWKQNGYLTVPEGVTAMNIPMWKNAAENVVYITNIQNDHLQKIPVGAYNDTNLWDILNHDNGYYNGTSWGPATVSGKVVKSVTIPVVPGDKIYASSFQAKAENGGIRNGIRVTYYNGNTVVQSIGPDVVYTDWNTDGYLEIPEGVNAVEIPVWEENGAVVNVLTLSARPVSGDAVAQIGTQEYTSLAAAVADAGDNAEIKLLTNASGAGIVIDKSITIDFNEHTYTVTYPTVGSAGTETNGFQILSGNEVTLKNGTLAAGLHNGEQKVKILVQNYADLTVTDMVLDGTNGCVDDNEFFTLSCNNGNVTVNGSTSIIAPDGHYALDSYNLMSPETYKQVSVTVNTTGTITGDIRVTGDKASLALEKAVVNGQVSIRKGADVVVGLTGGNNEDIKITGDYAIAVFGQGYADEATTLTVNSGTITGTTAYAISGNGSITDTYSYSNTKITVNGGIIKSEGTGFGGAAIYHPQGGILTINGGTITGLTGVEIRGGELQINGGTITATGEYADRLGTENGATTQGVAVAVNKYDHQNSSAVAITGGVINATNETGKILFVNEEMEGSTVVSGGTFNQAVAEEYCAEGFEPKDNGDGTFGVKKEIVVKHNLTLESYIDFSFFIPKSELAASGLTATIVHDRADGYDDKTVTLAQTEWVSTTVKGVDYWRIRYSDVAAKEMTDNLTLTVADGSGTIVTETYSVAAYAKERIANSTDNDMKALMNALLHYGAAAQTYFNYKTDNLANAGLGAAQAVFANSASSADTTVKHNLTLESDINFSFFIPKSELAASGLTATIVHDRADGYDDKTATLEQVEWESATVDGVEYWRIRYADVAAKEVSDNLTITISDGAGAIVTDTYSVQQYAQERIQNSSNENMKALMQSLLTYGDAAQIYFSKNVAN